MKEPFDEFHENLRVRSRREKFRRPAGIFIMILFLILCSIEGYSLATDGAEKPGEQDQRQITGTVKDKSDQPLPGVTVMVKGTSTGTLTDADGKFSLKVPASSRTLVFSFVGLKSLEVAMTSAAFDVVMEEDVASLDEVVVVGYGTMKKRDVIGASSAVKGADLVKAPVASAAEALTGRMAGVQLTTTEGQPGADIIIKVRGGTSISQDNAPLYIIDGFPSENGLKNISPSDIERIDVLKDASSTAIYGARGANGVILITTKGGSEGKANVSYDGWVGFKTLGRQLPVMDNVEFLKWQYERQMDVSTHEPSTSFLDRYGPWDAFGRYLDIPSINWQDKALGGNAYYQNHNLAITGGTKTTSYRISYSRDDEDGLLIGNGYNRNNFKLKLDQKVTDKLSFSANAGYSFTNIKGGGTSKEGKLESIVMYRPTTGLGIPGSEPVSGELSWEDLLTADEDNISGLVNPLVQAQAEHRLTSTGNLVFNAAVDYKILEGLTLRLLGGMNFNDIRYEQFESLKSSAMRSHGGPYGSIRLDDNKKYSNTAILTYTKSFNEIHDINLMAGQEYIADNNQMVTASASMYDSDDIGLANLAMGNEFPKPESRVEKNRLLSYFGRAMYTFNDKYFVTGTLRADGSSKFIEKNRWGYFPSVALAWQAGKEDFIKNLNIFSNLKVRLTYGVAGNNRIANNLFASTFKNVFYAADGTVNSVGLIPNATANPDLKWETTVSRNLGFDVGFFDDRISANVDLYLNTTRDLLLKTNIPSSSGYTTQFKNVGSTENKGIEVTLTTRNLKTSDFNWSTDFNIAVFNSRVTGLNKEATFSQDSFLENIYLSANYEAFLVKVGEPLGLIYGYVSDGFFTVDDFDYDAATETYTLKPGIAGFTGIDQKPGDMKFKDLGGDLDASGNPEITPDDDRTIIGRTQPKLFGGINNTFNYKNFDLSVFVNFSYGNQVLNVNKILYTSGYSTNKNLLAVMNGRFTYVNDQGEYVSDPDALRELNKNATVWAPERDLPRRFYSWAVEDGSFIRINNITAGYTLPKKICDKIKVDNIRVFGTAYNMFLFTKYSGFDPEVNAARSNPYTPGVDQSSYPKSRSLIGGLNIIF
ncbi:MAG TPA: TonB-dependent receptor [Bacteroidales bacterium]|nr:TonB-dependent receptor [Bacteroidales bacterium]